MKSLLTSIQRLAAKQKIFMFWHEVDTQATPAQAKASLKIHFEKELDSFFDGTPSVVNNSNEPERF